MSVHLTGDLPILKLELTNEVKVYKEFVEAHGDRVTKLYYQLYGASRFASSSQKIPDATKAKAKKFAELATELKKISDELVEDLGEIDKEVSRIE